jgi:hypothetical protein
MKGQIMPKDKETRAFVKADLEKAKENTKIARKNAKQAMKEVKKAGANTPEFKAIMKDIKKPK